MSLSSEIKTGTVKKQPSAQIRKLKVRTSSSLEQISRRLISALSQRLSVIIITGCVCLPIQAMLNFTGNMSEAEKPTAIHSAQRERKSFCLSYLVSEMPRNTAKAEEVFSR